MRIIALEEHYRYRDAGSEGSFEQGGVAHPAALLAKLDDVGASRIADMDAAGIDLEVLSHVTPGPAALEPARAVPLARRANDWAAEAVRRYPKRLAAFATLPMSDPDASAEELERTVRELGFKGALINGTSQGRFLDDPRFFPLLERAEALQVPLYLHPAPPPEPVMNAYFSGLDPALGRMLSMAGWGWHAETALHTLRLIVAGVFDRCPRLQLIIGHMGEMLPFMLARSNDVLTPFAKGLRRPVADYLRSNVHVTTSGMFTAPPLLLAIEVLGIDRIMFSVDYPYASHARGRAFLEALPFSPTDMDKLSHGNAERLLGL